VDPAVTIQRLYMIFYWMLNLGSLSSIATTELELHVGFWAAYLLPITMFIFAVVALVYGKRFYKSRRPRGSVVLNAFRALTIGIRAGWNLETAKPSCCDLYHLPYNTQWSDLFIDEIRRALVACRIFIFFPIVFCFQSYSNYSTGFAMDKCSAILFRRLVKCSSKEYLMI